HPLLLIARTAEEAARLEAWAGTEAEVDLLREPVDLDQLRGRVGSLLELRARREQLQGLLDEAAGEHARLINQLLQLPAAIAITRGTDFVFEFANAAYERLVGRPISLGQPLREAVPEIVSQRGVMDVLLGVMATGEPFIGREFPVSIRRRGDGSAEETFFDVIYQPIREDGEVRGLLTHAMDVTEQVRSRRLAEAAEARARFLAEAGERLGASLDVDAVLGEVARLAVPLIADWCTVDLLTADGKVERVAAAHADAARRELAFEVVRRWPQRRDTPGSLLAEVLRTGEPLRLERLSEVDLIAWARSPEHLALLRGLGPCSLLYVPLKARGQVLGALGLVQAESGRHFSSDDARFAAELARRASLSLDNALLYREARQAQERTARLQTFTAALARASTSEEVATAALEQGLRHLGAWKGSLSRVEHGWLHMLGAFGVDDAVAAAWRRMRLTDLPPVLQSVEQRQALWFPSRERWPRHTPRSPSTVRARAPCSRSWRTTGVSLAPSG
ncbi:GAF domain-containing protein, partial [Pyxidicoccus sp. 3LFB2]